MTKLKAVLFDLDGTLVHTASDITAALNAALVDHQLQPLSGTQAVSFIGRGARVLVERALAAQGNSDSRLADGVLERYLHHYKTQSGKLSTPLPGAADCLESLAESGFKIAVVTNALQRFAEPILERAGLSKYVDLVVGGDRLSVGKPHPAPLLFACSHFGVLPNETLMVGDSINDVEAARAAGCDVVCVANGYTGDRPLSADDCDVIDSLATLPAWIKASFPRPPRRAGSIDQVSPA